MGGRAQLVDLPAKLNIDLKYIEDRVYDMVKRSKGKLLLTEEGDLITTSYLTLVAQEINEAIAQVRKMETYLFWFLLLFWISAWTNEPRGSQSAIFSFSDPCYIDYSRKFRNNNQKL